MNVAIAMLVALVLDRLLGEPRYFHPLVGFGKLAQAIELRANKQNITPSQLKLRGIVSHALLVIPLSAITAYISYRYNSYFVFDVFILYLCLGARSLVEHAQQVADALLLKHIEQARTYTSYIVSRDTDKMTETDISRAAIESTLENGSDAIFAPLFWFAIGGAPAVVFYRLSNTLDAMWGYRTERYLHFGWAAARLDDVLNYIPARMTALIYACVGHFQSAIQCWRTQAAGCKSPNGGPVMSSGAGALALQLGGPTRYHGTLEDCPLLGCGDRPLAPDIMKATDLIQRGILFCACIALLVAGGLALA